MRKGDWHLVKVGVPTAFLLFVLLHSLNPSLIIVNPVTSILAGLGLAYITWEEDINDGKKARS